MSKIKSIFKHSAFKVALKFFLVVIVLWFLAKKNLLSMAELVGLFSSAERIQSLVLINLLFLAAFLLSVVRWRLLLKQAGWELSFLKVLQLTFVGQFFNVALPGAVSGDFIKAYEASRYLKTSGQKIFGNILIDRLIGLSGLVLVSVLGMLIYFLSQTTRDFYDRYPFFFGMVALGFFGVAAFYGILLHYPKVFGWIRIQKLAPLIESLQGFSKNKTSVLMAMILSVLIQGLVCLGFMFLARLLLPELFTTVHISYFLMTVPFGLLITAIPILPAGMGTGHAAFIVLMQMILHDTANSIGSGLFSLYVAFQLFLGMIGGVVYLFSKIQQPSKNSQKA